MGVNQSPHLEGPFGQRSLENVREVKTSKDKLNTMF